jgi:hypothetical protein
MQTIDSFLDSENRITKWPSKMAMKIEVIKYMAQFFEKNITYTEKEVNAIISKHHTFNDYFMLRRGLIDYKLLARTRNGSEYWKL